MQDIVVATRLRGIENEGKSCSFDPEVIVVHGSRFMVSLRLTAIDGS